MALTRPPRRWLSAIRSKASGVAGIEAKLRRLPLFGGHTCWNGDQLGPCGPMAPTPWQGAPTGTVTWSATYPVSLSPDRYRFSVVVTDIAGNSSEPTRREFRKLL